MYQSLDLFITSMYNYVDDFDKSNILSIETQMDLRVMYCCKQ